MSPFKRKRNTKQNSFTFTKFWMKWRDRSVISIGFRIICSFRSSIFGFTRVFCSRSYRVGLGTDSGHRRHWGGNLGYGSLGVLPTTTEASETRDLLKENLTVWNTGSSQRESHGNALLAWRKWRSYWRGQCPRGCKWCCARSWWCRCVRACCGKWA